MNKINNVPGVFDITAILNLQILFGMPTIAVRKSSLVVDRSGRLRNSCGDPPSCG